MTKQRTTASKLTSPLPARDRAVVELIGKFRQMSARQIRDSLFHDITSLTPLDRTLKRLVDAKYLERLQRPVGGHGGGSASFVYQVGRAGWRLLERPGAFWAPRAINLHTLAVADCFVRLKRAEHRGDLVVLKFDSEPDCHTSVGDVRLTPDGYVEVGDRRSGSMFRFWLEVDRGTEHVAKIMDKCFRYWRGFQLWREEYYPQVLFVVPDQRRVTELRRIVRGGSDEAQVLFRVTIVNELVAACTIPRVTGAING